MDKEDTLSNLTGACRCGTFQFRARRAPIQVSYCHCGDCRRATGAPVTVFVGFTDEDIDAAGRQADAYRSSPAVQRLFCAACGTPVGYRDDRLPRETYFYLGIIDQAWVLEPTLHAWTTERLDWLNIDDNLPACEGFSRNREERT